MVCRFGAVESADTLPLSWLSCPIRCFNSNLSVTCPASPPTCFAEDAREQLLHVPGGCSLWPRKGVIFFRRFQVQNGTSWQSHCLRRWRNFRVADKSLSILDDYWNIRENGDIITVITDSDLDNVSTIGVRGGIEREVVADRRRCMWPLVGHVWTRSTIRGSSGRDTIHINVYF